MSGPFPRDYSKSLLRKHNEIVAYISFVEWCCLYVFGNIVYWLYPYLWRGGGGVGLTHCIIYAHLPI